MTSVTAFVALCMIAVAIEARYIDKDVAGSRYASKVFDYYDVAKGNVPSYLITGDKQLEDYEEDREPVKIGQESDNLRDMIKQESLSERPVAPAEEIQPETLDAYEDYAEQAVNKPLEIPVADSDLETDTDSDDSKPAESDSSKDKLIIDSDLHETVETPQTPETPETPEKQPNFSDKLTLTDTEDDSDLIITNPDPSAPPAITSQPPTTTEEPINDTVDDVMVLETVKPLCDDKATTQKPE